MSILTLEEAKQHLRYDDADQDAYIQGLIAAAEQAIKDYVGESYSETNDAMKQAAKLLIGYFDNFRNAENEAPVNGFFLPAPALALLYKYRTPTAI